jgi:hypothetical protein
MKYLSSRYDCVLAAFLDHNSTCNYKPIPVIPNPFFYFHEFQAVYSVPQSTTIRTTCTDIKNTKTISNYVISGVGNLHFPPNCKIVTTNPNFEFHYSTPAVTDTVDITNWQTFDNIKYKDIPDKTILQTYQQLNITVLEPTMLTIPTWQELLKDSVSLKKVLPTWAQVIVLAIICISIFFLVKYLNTITCCDAVKGAYHKRIRGTTRRFANWRTKRANYFNSIKTNTPSIDPISFNTLHHKLSPQDNTPSQVNTENFDTDFRFDYIAQFNEANLAAQNRIHSADVIPEPPKSNIEQRHSEIAHKYNTRSKHIIQMDPESEPTVPSYTHKNTGFQFN